MHKTQVHDMQACMYDYLPPWRPSLSYAYIDDVAYAREVKYMPIETEQKTRKRAFFVTGAATPRTRATRAEEIPITRCVA
jgi:hypothetical protein